MDVALDERSGVSDRTIDVRLGSEVHDGVDSREQVVDERPVPNIALDELVAGMIENATKVVGGPRVRQRVECDDRNLRLFEEVPDEIGPDESRAAGDQNAHPPFPNSGSRLILPSTGHVTV